METEYDYLFKIVLIGDAGVGKTSIVRRYTDGIFTSAGIPTIGVDFCIKTLQIGSSAVKVGILLPPYRLCYSIDSKVVESLFYSWCLVACIRGLHHVAVHYYSVSHS